VQTITYFYSAHSAFAYLGSARLNAIAANANCRINHKPIDLNRCIAAAGVSGFGQRTKAHVDYFFGQEINRWSEYRNAPVLGRIPTHHANDPALANGMLIAGERQGLSVDALAHEFLQAHWRDDADLADRKTLVDVAESAGYEPQALLDAASTQAVLDVYANNTDEAIRLSVFGSPTYFFNDEMFYGQDRLEFIERMLANQ
jgi:2-hydroxychromene-2-carboxylate isomerase